MKLVTYACDRGQRLGALDMSGGVLDLRDLAEAGAAAGGAASPADYASMLALLRAGPGALEHARHLVATARTPGLPMADVRLCAPLPVPEQIRDFANYELHVQQALASSMRLRSQAAPDPASELARLQASGMFAIPPVWYERPLYYKCNRFSVVGHEAEIEWPVYAGKMDYELELAVVIGRTLRNASEQEAMEGVFGYTIFNDFSARDTQAQETQFRMGPAKGKDFDTGNVFGPCITTRDEIPDPMALRMSVRVNGVPQQATSASAMQHSVARCISFVSQSETLHPGEILGLGTVGNGCGYESLRFLEPGDTVELEIENIGVLRNRLGPRPQAAAGGRMDIFPDPGTGRRQIG